MKRFKFLIGLLGLAMICVVAPVGCANQRLAPDGPYAGDKVLYNAEKTITTVYKQFDTFLKWELQYRAVLPVEVSRAADVIRANAKNWINSAIAARDAYVAVPNAPNKDKLNLALNLIDAALSEAAKYMLENQAKAPNAGTANQPSQ